MNDIKDAPTVTIAVIQRYAPNARILELLEMFRQMVNDCMKIGLANDVSTLKKLSSLSYRKLSR